MKRFGACVLAGIGLAVALPAANAGVGQSLPSDSLGKANGLNYRSVSYSPFDDDIDLFAKCNEGDAVAGGGVNVNSTDAHVAYGFPGDDSNDPDEKPDDWWSGAARSLGPTDLRLTTYATCKTHRPGQLKYVLETTGSVPVGGTYASEVMCPAGTGVVSGGTDMYRGRQSISAPLDGNDQDRVPDDGWRVKVLNEESISPQPSVHAICISSGVLAYSKETGTVRAQKAKQVRKDCPPSTAVIGGGWKVNGAPLTHWVSSSRFADTRADADKVPENRWTIKATNDAAQGTRATVYAICLR
jgi:hypothetical protein